MYDNAKHRSRECQLAWQLLRNSPTVQMLPMMGRNVLPEVSRLLFGNVESGRGIGGAYFETRSEEERAAAANADGLEARRAHQELARLYAMLSRRPAPWSNISRQRQADAPPPASSEAARRQDALLDDALKETFPASDPVSVFPVS